MKRRLLVFSHTFLAELLSTIEEDKGLCAWCMLIVSGSYRNDQKCAVSIQLTDLPESVLGMEESGEQCTVVFA